VELRQGQALTLGDALVWLEDESLEAGAGRPGGTASHVASPGARPTGRSAGGSSAGKGRGATTSAMREASRQRAMEAARSRPSRSKVQRSRPRVQRGLPSGAMVGIVLAVVVIAGFLLRKGFQVSAENVVDPRAMLQSVGNAIEEASYEEASRLLAQLPSDKLSRAQRDLVATYDEQIEDGFEARRKAAYYRTSHKWFETYLKGYESKWLQGEPPKSRIRFFLKNAREFRERWPEHEEIDWVNEAVDADVARQAMPYLTTTSRYFSADIVAVGKHGRGYRRARFVYDLGGEAPVIVYRHNLNRLGWALGSLERRSFMSSLNETFK